MTRRRKRSSKTRAKPPAEVGSPSVGGDAEGPRPDVEESITEQSMAAHGLLEILASKRRLMGLNFLAGLSRGVGFFLGVTLVGGLVLGSLALSIDSTLRTFGAKITLNDVVRQAAEKSQEIQALWRQQKEQIEARAEAGGPAPDDVAPAGDARDDETPETGDDESPDEPAPPEDH